MRALVSFYVKSQDEIPLFSSASNTRLSRLPNAPVSNTFNELCARPYCCLKEHIFIPLPYSMLHHDVITRF
jgi:hypothetical protein